MTAGAFTPATRKVIHEREGERCARCGHGALDGQIHHRRPRGMGGDSRVDTASAANGLLLCAWCHNWIERNRAAAMEAGWLVEAEDDPQRAPVLYAGSWYASCPTRVLLTADGGVQPELPGLP